MRDALRGRVLLLRALRDLEAASRLLDRDADTLALLRMSTARVDLLTAADLLRDAERRAS